MSAWLRRRLREVEGCTWQEYLLYNDWSLGHFRAKVGSYYDWLLDRIRHNYEDID